MFLNVLAPVGAPADVGVPPDAETFGFERGHQRLDPCAVFSLVRNEYVRRLTPHSSPLRDVNGATLRQSQAISQTTQIPRDQLLFFNV